MGYLLSSHCAQTTHEIQDSPRQRQHDWSCAKKNIVQPHRKKCWVIPPEANSAFVAAMEDVLAVYMRPHDPERPLVCLDERDCPEFRVWFGHNGKKGDIPW